MSFFSVIIPLYNKEPYIKNTLNSVLNQNFKDFEVIIVDDGSTDNSFKIISKFKDSRIIKIQQKNQGVSVARNTGIIHANSEYISLLDADDLWKKNHLEELYKAIELFPEADLYCNNYEINYNQKITLPAKHNFKYHSSPLIIENFFSSSKFSPIIYPSSACFKKAILKNLGLFNPLYDSAEDLDIWIKIGLNHKIIFNPIITMSYSSNISNSLSNSNYNLNQYRLFSSLIDKEKNNIELKKFIDRKRYGLALRAKINNDKIIFSKTIKDIDFNNINTKEKTLLKLNYHLLKTLNHIRAYLMKNSFYLRLFK